MKVFISWSGGASRSIAEALREWLPSVVQAVRPFLSSEDIHKGKPWFEEIGTQLEETHFGILCMTPANLDAPWIHFEAGALSKRVAKANVVPLLIGLGVGALKPPLTHLNAALATKEEVARILRGMNAALGENKLADAVLNKAFERAWPELEEAITKAVELARAETGARPQAKRDQAEQVEELLAITRGVAEQLSAMRHQIADAIRSQSARHLVVTSDEAGGIIFKRDDDLLNSLVTVKPRGLRLGMPPRRPDTPAAPPPDPAPPDPAPPDPAPPDPNPQPGGGKE